MADSGPCQECRKTTTGWLVADFICDDCYDKLEAEARANRECALYEFCTNGIPCEACNERVPETSDRGESE